MTRKNRRRRGAKRRIDKLELDEVSGVTVPAQTPALARIAKSGARSDEEFEAWLETLEKGGESGDETAKSADLVAMTTASAEGHQHGVTVWSHEDDLGLVVSYAASEDGETHDHQIVRDEDGSYVVTENRGHTHGFDTERLMRILFDRMAKADSEIEGDDSALSDGSFPLLKRADVRVALDLIHLAKEGQRSALAAHIENRARALGAADLIPAEGVLADLQKHGDQASEIEMKPEEIQKLNDRIEVLEKSGERKDAVLKLGANERAYFDGLADEKAQDEFLAKSAEDQAKLAESAVAKAADSDPVVYTTISGLEIRKSHGDVALTLAKQADDDRRETAKERARTEKARIEKRAKDEFAGMAGSDQVHVEVVKALESIEDEGVRAEAFAMVKASKSVSDTDPTTSVGTSAAPRVEKSGSAKEAEARLDQMAKEAVKKSAEAGEPIDYFEAYDRVSKKHPDVLEKALVG